MDADKEVDTNTNINAPQSLVIPDSLLDRLSHLRLPEERVNFIQGPLVSEVDILA